MHREILNFKLGDKEISFETGKIARQANGSVLVKMGDSYVFSAACAAEKPQEGIDFFPLRIDYQEKFSSAGKTLGGYLKREGRPSEKEILTCRLIDRPLRPMFEDGYYNEVQILNYVWSYDGVHSTEPLAICAASAALVISDIPLKKPIGAVRVGRLDGKFVINPTVQEQETSDLDLVIAGTEDAVLMIEGYCDFLTEDEVIQSIEAGHEAIKVICQHLSHWQKTIGKEKNLSTLLPPPSDEVFTAVKEAIGDQLTCLRIKDKEEREEATSKMKETLLEKLCPEEGAQFDESEVKFAFKKVQSDYMRDMILNEGVRTDGRKTTDIRPIDIELSLLPRVHGSALFTRGETQSVAVCTLGGETMGQRFESLDGEGAKRFYLQYSFPPFSVGEVGRAGPPGRREIGHGKLAERALMHVIPTKEDFPYIIRVESNITESNGSSSMASVCGGCLALMNAGVPVRKPVSGIAMGLILEKDKHTILSDILGLEDALGDMDFKITGDQEGITAFQMDIKVEGITIEIMKSALAQAKEGRVHILNKMLEASPTHAEDVSIYAPRIVSIQVKQSQIGTIIGPGGKQIRAITEETGVQIDINDDGIVSIASNDKEALEKAVSIVEGLVAEVEEGKTYDGTIKKIMPFGLFVEVLPGKEGLCHISEYDLKRIEDLNDVVKEGDKITVKVLEIGKDGKVRLSRKALLKKASA